MKIFSTLFAAVAALPLCFAFSATAATPEDFRTDEYNYNVNNGKALDYIHAAEAYALGFTGKGVTVGVIDTGAYPGHQEFSAKSPYPVLYYDMNADSILEHGVHVAGTVAASKNGLGMHGVAFDAGLVSFAGYFNSAFSGRANLLAALGDLRNYPQVSIVNNSWASGEFLFLAPWATEPGFRLGMAEFAHVMAPLAAERDILFVFAAGNESTYSPQMPVAISSALLGTTLMGHSGSGGVRTILPFDFLTYGLKDLEPTQPQKRALSLNMLSVINFDPTQATTSLAFIHLTATMADGITNYSLLAPGTDIWSAVSDLDTGASNKYQLMSGSSMSAPHVSGVAALVKEAFPYMGGKQLADVLLSTATPLSIAALPPLCRLDR